MTGEGASRRTSRYQRKYVRRVTTDLSWQSWNCQSLIIIQLVLKLGQREHLEEISILIDNSQRNTIKTS